MTAEKEKRRAAEAALSHVVDGMTLGVGTGSTVDCFIELLAERVASEGITVTAVPSSYATELRLRDAGIPVHPLNTVTTLPLAIDGADEVDPHLALIKGGGAALLREKVLAEAAQQLVIIVDSSKLVSRLGERTPVPVEVLPAALALCRHRIRRLGGNPVLRQAKRKAGPVVTDNGNLILDASFPSIPDPAKLEAQLNAIPGVLENGLFPSHTDIVYVGHERGVRRLQRSENRKKHGSH